MEQPSMLNQYMVQKLNMKIVDNSMGERGWDYAYLSKNTPTLCDRFLNKCLSVLHRIYLYANAPK